MSQIRYLVDEDTPHAIRDGLLLRQPESAAERQSEAAQPSMREIRELLRNLFNEPGKDKARPTVRSSELKRDNYMYWIRLKLK